MPSETLYLQDKKKNPPWTIYKADSSKTWQDNTWELKDKLS